jgi:hypothetical protein
MSDLQAVLDRVEVEALRGAFTDAVMMRDYDRVASLFTQDGAVRMPHIATEAVSREEIRAGVERLVTVTGELAIGSSRVRLELPVNVDRLADGALRLEGRTTVARQTAGLGWNKLGMIRGDASAARPAHAQASPMSS